MKKRNLAIALSAILIGIVFAFLYFSVNKPQNYVKQELSKAQTEGKYLDRLLEEEENRIEKSYTLSLSQKAKARYQEFLQTSLSKVEFDVKKSGKTKDDVVTVSVSFEPLDLSKTMKDLLEKEKMEISSADFSTELAHLLEEETKALDDRVMQSGTKALLEVKKTDKGYKVSNAQMISLIKAALPGYMESYSVLEDIFDKQDYLKAFLDAYLKGDTQRLAVHTQMSKEEVDEWYRQGFEGEAEGFSSEDIERLTTALMDISAACQYEIGIPKKNANGEYEIAVHVIPNTSRVKAKEELDAMEFQSAEEVASSFLSVYEKYAQNPTFADPTDLVFLWNASTTFQDVSPGTYVGNFIGIIYPTE